MWYRTAIDFGKLFGFGQPQPPAQPQPVEKPAVPDDVFKDVVQSNIPNPITVNQLDHSKGDYHLILTGAGNIHQGSSHSNYIDNVLERSRESLKSNPEISEKYNVRRLPSKAYGPMDYAEDINFNSGNERPFMSQEDAVTDILHDYFDKGIRISSMGDRMTINANHIPGRVQMKELFKIMHMIQPQSVLFKVKTDKGVFLKSYNIDDVFDFEDDVKSFDITGKIKQSRGNF